MNRRRFLDPRQLARQAIDLLGIEDSLQGFVKETFGEPLLVRCKRQAMATQFEALFPLGTPQAYQAGAAALDEVDALEAQLTVYRADSEMSLINQHAPRVPVKASANLFDLLLLCRHLHVQTHGAFDPALGVLIKTWGFFRRQGSVPEPEALAAARQQSGMAHVQLDSAEQTVAYDVPGLEINLGSIGKGFALDQAIKRVRQEYGIKDVLLHGGQSSVFAMGREPGAQAGWQVQLADADLAGSSLGWFWLQNRGLGISSATYQNLEFEGRKLSHHLDPRTGWPVEGLACAAATAPSAAEADALATAFFLLGVEETKTYLQTHPQIGAVLVEREPRTIHVLGRACEEWQSR